MTSKRAQPFAWEAIGRYAAAVGRARATGEPRCEPHLPHVPVERVFAFRAAASGLAARLPGGALARAARGGLQDSAPRAGLLALHARVRDVGPDSWEDPALAQVWLRWADYIVPREDLAVFTLGASPRDPAAFRALDDVAAAVAASASDEPVDVGVIARGLTGIPDLLLIRSVVVAGRFVIRWDARRVTIEAAPASRDDVEGARLELARRHLRWLAPSWPGRFARWAGVSRDDAATTWRALEPELVDVELAGRKRSILKDDASALLDREPAMEGVRFLPMGDPALYPDALAPVANRVIEMPAEDRRLLNSLTGRIMVDGTLVGAWGRKQRRLTIVPWRPDATLSLERIVSEAESMAGPMGGPMRIDVLD